MRNAGRVLVVDDDLALLGFLDVALRAEGYAVETAADAGTALDWLWATWDAQPDVILLDLRLPSVDGKMFAELYRALPVRHASIVLMSALPEAAEAAPDVAARDVLRKPFDLDDLLERLRRAALPPAS
jgi:two-component system KDP operon response regulator KdpE